MKRCLDNFLSNITSGDLLNPTAGPIHNQVNPDEHFIKILPPELVLRIFSHFSETNLRLLCSVSKKFEVLAKSDYLWQTIAESILFPEECAIKPMDKSYRDYCKDSLILNKLETGLSHPTYFLLKPRDPAFVHKVKQMQISAYKIFTSSEVKAYFRTEEVRRYILDEWWHISQAPIEIHHRAHQQIGDRTYNILNFTDYVVSIDSHRHLLINNKLTDIMIIPEKCNLFIYIRNNDFHIRMNDLPNQSISSNKCSIHNLALEDYSTIEWRDSFT